MPPRLSYLFSCLFPSPKFVWWIWGNQLIPKNSYIVNYNYNFVSFYFYLERNFFVSSLYGICDQVQSHVERNIDCAHFGRSRLYRICWSTSGIWSLNHFVLLFISFDVFVVVSVIWRKESIKSKNSCSFIQCRITV